MINPSQGGTLVSPPKTHTSAIKPAMPVSPPGLSAPSVRRSSISASFTPTPRAPTLAPITPGRRTSLLNAPLRTRSASIVVSATNKSTPVKAPIKEPVKRPMASSAPSVATTAQEKEDRFSRLTRPTRSSSQKAVEVSPRPAPKRPPGLTKPTVTVGTEAGRRPRATSIALTKSAVPSVKPTARSPPRYGNAISRPAVSKNTALAPSSTRTPVSPPKVSASLVKEDAQTLAVVQEERGENANDEAVEDAVSTPAETTSEAEETEGLSSVGDVQLAPVQEQTQLAEEVLHTPSDSDPQPAGSVNIVAEIHLNEVQELESDSSDVSVNGSLLEPELPSSNDADATSVDTLQREETTDVVSASEATSTATVSITGASDVSEDSVAVAADNKVATVAFDCESPDTKAEDQNTALEDIPSRILDQVDIVPKPVDDLVLSPPEEDVLTDDTDKNNEVSLQTDCEVDSEKDGNDTKDVPSSINEEEIKGKRDGATSAADSLNDTKEAVAASESLNDVIQYYSSSSDDEPAEDSETTASESSSFGSLVGACSSSESDKKPPKKGDASNGRKCDASSSFESIVDAYSSSESSTFDTSLIIISAPDSDESSSSISSLISAYSSDDSTTPQARRCSKVRSTTRPLSFGPVLPPSLSFHPSHHPRNFLRVPEWSYGRTKRQTFDRIKLSLPPIKALRVAPKPPVKKEKLPLEATPCTPKPEGLSASDGARAVKAPVKEEAVPQTTAVEALHLLKKIHEKKTPGGAFAGSDKKTDALDEEFSEDPFLDSLRWLYTSRVQLWRSELIGDDDDDDDDGEPDMDAYLESLAPRMAARAAAWRATDAEERTPAVKEFRESFVRLQALVSEIEQDKSLFSEGPTPPVVEDVAEKPVLCAPGFSEDELTQGIGSVDATDFPEMISVQQEGEEHDSMYFTASQKGKERDLSPPEDDSDDEEPPDTIPTIPSECSSDRIMLIEEEEEEEGEVEEELDIPHETYLSYLVSPETPQFMLGGTWTLAVLPSAGYTSPRSHSSMFIPRELPSRPMRDELPSNSSPTSSSARQSVRTIGTPSTPPGPLAVPPFGTNNLPSGTHNPSVVAPAGMWARLFGPRRSPSPHSLANSTSRPSFGSGHFGRMRSSIPPILASSPPPSPAASEVSESTEESDGSSGSASEAGSPPLPADGGAPSAIRPSLSSSRRSSGLKNLFSRWF